MNKILKELGIDYLLVNSTNEFLVEYPLLVENARYTLTGFSGSTGDALLTNDGIYLFVDGRYHTQADKEVYNNVKVVKLELGQNQDDEIRKLIDKDKVLGIVAKKVSQKRLETFKGYCIKLLETDPINNYTEVHDIANYVPATKPVEYKPSEAVFLTNLEEVSYLTGLRDFSKDFSSKIWAKMFINGDDRRLFYNERECSEFLKTYEGALVVDKSSINAYDFNLIKVPVHKDSVIKSLKAVKSKEEIEAYKKDFMRTEKALMAVRNYIEENDKLSEYDIEIKLREEFKRNGAISLSFKPIVAIDKNSALAHYSKSSKDVILKEGSLVLIDCGAYYETGIATDITRVFVKGKPSDLQKKVYTTVLKAFLSSYNANFERGYDYDCLAHEVLDNKIDGFSFSHGLGHGIGINVHEAPPALNKTDIAKDKLKDNMTFTIEPGLYNPEFFGVRLENSCYKTKEGINSFVHFGYEKKLINESLLSEKERVWLKDFRLYEDNKC